MSPWRAKRRGICGTLAIADRALYRAKADGRNRVAPAPLVVVGRDGAPPGLRTDRGPRHRSPDREAGLADTTSDPKVLYPKVVRNSGDFLLFVEVVPFFNLCSDWHHRLRELAGASKFVAGLRVVKRA